LLKARDAIRDKIDCGGENYSGDWGTEDPAYENCEMNFGT
jgi:hypothetical protein